MKNKSISGDSAAQHNTKACSEGGSSFDKIVPNHGNGPRHGNDPELPLPHGNVASTDNRNSKFENRNSAEAVPHPRNSGPHASVQFEYDAGPTEYIEPLVTRETVCKHYKIGLRTLTYAMSLGLPSIQIGRARRFKLSEVQPWFEKNGYRRIASEGRKLAIQKALLKAKQFHLALSPDVQVVNVNEPKRKTKSPPTTTKAKKGRE